MKRILIQFDTDPLPSTFDRVVAVDAGAEELFSYGGVTPENVTGLVHGAIFTRHPKDLQQTAIFIGGSDVAAGEALLAQVVRDFFGPLRVSVMMDSNGSNTTAAAAVLAAARRLELGETTALVLGGTGPVGFRAAQLLAGEGAAVRLGSRSRDRAAGACTRLGELVGSARFEPVSNEELETACRDAQLIVAAGAAGVELLSAERRQGAQALRLAIDLNAVPPAGLAGIDPQDRGADRDGVICYGALGVGGDKMKIHKACLARLFERNDLVLDTAAIYEIARSLGLA